MYRHLLVPLDGSQRAERAVPVAERIARATGSHLTLLQAISLPLPIGAPYDAAAVSSYSIEHAEAQSSAYLARVAGWPLLSGLEVDTKVMAQSPALAILNGARETGADLIVICSHGHTGATRWILGSVAEHVARQSLIPVLVLREHGPTPAHLHPDPAQPLRILVPLDGSAFAEAALTPAADLILALAGPKGGALHLTVALPPYDLDRENVPETLALDGARDYLRRTAEHLRQTAPALRVSWSVTAGLDAAQAVIQVAETGEDTAGAGPESRCDLIAMATHGRSGIARWAMGSITERVLHGTKLPLLIVRPAAVVQQTAPSVSADNVAEIH
jgi:nucleotide-binding universal stress UspA family protein